MIRQADSNWEICAEAADGGEAVEKARELKPDLVILDFSMPVANGVTAGKQIRALLPDAGIIVYSSMLYLQLTTLAEEAGLDGVVDKANARSLIPEIRKVLSLKRITGGDGTSSLFDSL